MSNMKLKYLYMGALAMTTLTACENLSTEPDGATLTEEKKKEIGEALPQRAEAGVREGEKIDMAFTPQVNEYRGNVTVQLVAAAVRPHDPRALCNAILHNEASCLWAAAGYCPERPDFVRIWRGMKPGFRVGADTDGVLAQCLRDMEPSLRT